MIHMIRICHVRLGRNTDQQVSQMCDFTCISNKQTYGLMIHMIRICRVRPKRNTNQQVSQMCVFTCVSNKKRVDE